MIFSHSAVPISPNPLTWPEFDNSEQCSLLCCGTRSWIDYMIINPEQAWVKIWDESLRVFALYNFFIVPIQICSTEVQTSLAIMIANYVSPL